MHFRKTENPRTPSTTHTYQTHVLCRTSTMVAAGALGFRVEFDNMPGGVSANRGQVCEAANLDVLDGRESRKDSQTTSHDYRGNGRVSTEPFGPLKTALESTSTVYARYKVSSRHSTEIPLD